MMTQVEYLLENYYEETPEWLYKIDKDSDFPWKEFFNSRTVYYPGCGLDAHPVIVFSQGHSAHCFLYTDYLISESTIQKEMNEKGFLGYKIINEKKVPIEEYNSMFEVLEEYNGEFKNPCGRLRNRKRDNRYVHTYVMERLPEYGEEHGVDRFAIVFLGYEAYSTFIDVYIRARANCFAMLVDSNMMCSFSEPGDYLPGMGMEAEVMPELILFNSTGWIGYGSLDDVLPSQGGRYHINRWLQKKMFGCKEIRELYKKEIGKYFISY